MKRHHFALPIVFAVANGAALAMTAFAAPADHGKGAAAGASVEAPTVQSLAGFLEKELRWGMTHQQVIDAYNGKSDGSAGGLFDADYAPVLAKAPVGPKYDNVLNDMKSRKTAFVKSYTEFKTDPTGFDALPIKDEYTYNNNEALMHVQRNGKKRYFFFINDKLWKVYDEYPLKADGTLGASYQEAVAKLQAALSVAPKTKEGIAEWQDANSFMRIIDRGANVVAVMLANRSTLNNIDNLRKNKPVDPFALDPSVAAITKGGVSDPNASKPAPSSSAKGSTPKKK